jgi:hypothetical protein
MNTETPHGPLDGPPDGLPTKACPRATTRLDKLDPGRRRLDDRVMRRRTLIAWEGRLSILEELDTWR